MKKIKQSLLTEMPFILSRVTITLICLFVVTITFSQNVGIGTATPQRLFSVNGSILLDQSNTNDGALDSAALLLGTQGGVGIASKKTSAGLQNGMSLYTNYTRRLNITSIGNIGIGIESPESKLHVGGGIKSAAEIWAMTNGRFDGRLSVGGGGLPEYKLYVHNGNSFFQGNTTTTGNMTVNNDGIVNGNFRVDGRIGVNGATNASYGLIVNNANSYFQGNTTTSGNATVQGNVNVSNDGIVNGNFRVDGRIGVNGATNASYGLIVNNANSYFQGNTTTSGNATVQGNTNLQGNVTIQGNGHVRSNGTSNLRIGFMSLYTNDVYDGHGEEAKTVSIPAFDGPVDNIRVMIAQFEPEPGLTETSHFKWYVYDVDSVNHTAKIRIINQSGQIRVLWGTFYLMAVAKD